MIEPNGDIIYPHANRHKVRQPPRKRPSEPYDLRTAQADREQDAACDRHCLIYCHAEHPPLMSLRKLVPYARDIVTFRKFG